MGSNARDDKRRESPGFHELQRLRQHGELRYSLTDEKSMRQMVAALYGFVEQKLVREAPDDCGECLVNKTILIIIGMGAH